MTESKSNKHKCRRVLRIIAVIMLVCGIGVLLAPKAMQYVYRMQTDKIITAFEDDKVKSKNSSKSNKTDNKLDELYEKLKAENEKLYSSGQSGLVDPFSYSQPSVSLKKYGLSGNIIGYIKVEKMGIKLPVYLGANLDNMNKGAVHLTNTSYPIGGNNTNAVIAAHRDSMTKWMFQDINKLMSGDDVYFINFRETLHYKVKSYEIIKPNDSDRIKIQSGKDMLTLISCNPYGYNYQRYIVYCERV